MRRTRELVRASATVARVEHANTVWSRGRGLLGRRELGADEGIVLDPCGSVHTSFMRFPIDVIFLDGSWTVIKVVPGLRPWRLRSGGRGARRTVELAAGRAVAAGVRIGDRLELR